MSRVLCFRNRQRAHALDVPLLRRIVRSLLEKEWRLTDYELAFHFVDAAEMTCVNEQYLHHSGSTDVITFNYGETAAGIEHESKGRNAKSKAPPLHGEIYISVPNAVAQAKEFGTSWQSEVVRYAIHGLLHLRGYDDVDPASRRVMKREEERSLKAIERRFPLRNLARKRK
jgi:probable rRNA maturation factor